MKIYEVTLTTGQQVAIDFVTPNIVGSMVQIGDHLFNSSFVAAIIAREVEVPEEVIAEVVHDDV